MKTLEICIANYTARFETRAIIWDHPEGVDRAHGEISASLTLRSERLLSMSWALIDVDAQRFLKCIHATGGHVDAMIISRKLEEPV